MHEQRLQELEDLRQRAREIKLFRLTEEEGDFLRSLHYKAADEFSRDDEAKLRALVQKHWRREE